MTSSPSHVPYVGPLTRPRAKVGTAYRCSIAFRLHHGFAQSIYDKSLNYIFVLVECTLRITRNVKFAVHKLSCEFPSEILRHLHAEAAGKYNPGFQTENRLPRNIFEIKTQSLSSFSMVFPIASPLCSFPPFHYILTSLP